MVATVKEYIPGVNEKPRVDITSDKFAHKFTVQPAKGGFVFFEVAVSKGQVPKELAGLYSKLKDAVKAVLRYEELAAPSKTVKREANAAARQAQKEAAEV